MPDLVFPSADGNRVILEHKLTVYWYIVAFPVQKKTKTPIIKNYENHETWVLAPRYRCALRFEDDEPTDFTTET